MTPISPTKFSIDTLFSKNAQISWLILASLAYLHSFGTAPIADAKTWILVTCLLIFLLVKLLFWINHRCKPRFSHNSPTDIHQLVLIIGGSRGLGSQLVKLFLENSSCKVCLIDCIEPPHKDLPRFSFYKIDVADSDTLISTFHRIQHDLGPVTTLINNVGIAPIKNFQDMSVADIQRVISVNLTSYLLSMNYFLSQSLKLNTPLYIINIASVLGLVSPAYLTLYSATKAAIIAAHESIFHEMANSSQHSKIGLLLVKIGQLDTTLFAKVDPPRQFLAPVLSHKDIALKLWQKWLIGQVGEVSWPGYAHFGSIFKILPYTIVEPLRWFARIDKSTKENH